MANGLLPQQLSVEFFLHATNGQVKPVKLLEAADTAVRGQGAGHIYCRVAGAIWLELTRRTLIPDCVKDAAEKSVATESQAMEIGSWNRKGGR